MRFKTLLLLLLFLSSHATAQQEPADAQFKQLLQHLAEYKTDAPQEKVYLHLDKPYYVAGEDIWFKAYITVGPFNFLSAISNILYVELIDMQDKIVLSRRLPAVSGLSFGDFKLPDTLDEGSYRIRAYTNWMRNFDEALFFDKTVQIGNSLSNGLIVSSNFNYREEKDHRSKMIATIAIKDLDGRLFANRPVVYEISWGGKRASKGKVLLDEAGILHLETLFKEDEQPVDGILLLRIENDGNPALVKEIRIPKKDNPPDIQFYPEAGTLLANTFNRIGFSASDGQGKGLPVSGYIERAGEKLISFQSDHVGIGSFSINPEADKEYKAVIEFNGGLKIEKKLPMANTNGYTLAVNNAIESTIWAQIGASEGLVDGKTISLIAQQEGEVFYAAKSKLNKPDVTVGIPRKNLPSGIIELLLLDDHMNLLAKRSLLNFNQADLIPLLVSSSKNSYHTREKIELAIKAEGLDDSLHLGNFSIAVTNLTKIRDSLRKQDNILSALLLTSSTKQYIEEPGYYFEGKGKNVDLIRRLDDLMLTLKSDSSFWPKMKTGTFSKKPYQAEKEMQISGMVTRRNGNPEQGAKVTVISPQHITAVLDTLTDADGRFAFRDLVFFDSTRFVVQARDAKGKKNVLIKMDDLGQQKVSPNKNAPDEITETNKALGDYLKLSNRSLTELQKFGLLERSIQLDEVEVKATKENPAKYSANLNGPGNADQVISGDETFFAGCPTLDLCLNGRLLGVTFRNGVPESTRSPGRPMQIVVDGMYLDASVLNTIAPTDVASVEVLRNGGNTAIYGSFGANGVIIITTRRGDQPRKYDVELYTPGILTYQPQGLYQARLFRSPDYSQEEEKPGMKDLRTTIYWNPTVFTDKKGENHLSFYAADEPGVYQIVVEGMDTEGHLGRSVTYIRVE